MKLLRSKLLCSRLLRILKLYFKFVFLSSAINVVEIIRCLIIKYKVQEARFVFFLLFIKFYSLSIAVN